MRYEAPELKVIEIDTVDVIQASNYIGDAGENESPFNPASLNELDIVY